MKPDRQSRFDKLLQIRAPESLSEAIDAAARRRMTSRSNYVRDAILNRLAADGISIGSRPPVMAAADAA